MQVYCATFYLGGAVFRNPPLKAAVRRPSAEGFGGPVPGEHVGELRLWHVGDTSEDVGEPSLRTW